MYDNIMDIYSPEGTKVRFTGEGGYASDMKRGMETLSVGAIYTVSYTFVGGWYSDVVLKEFPDKKFNTVMFDKVEDA